MSVLIQNLDLTFVLYCQNKHLESGGLLGQTLKSKLKKHLNNDLSLLVRNVVF